MSIRHPRYITEIQGHDGSIKIRTESHVSDANAPSNIIAYVDFVIKLPKAGFGYFSNFKLFQTPKKLSFPDHICYKS